MRHMKTRAAVIISSPESLSVVFLLHNDNIPHEASNHDEGLEHTIRNLQTGLGVVMEECLCPLLMAS